MKIGRNDPCSCGSGKKYKNCCVKTGTRSEKKWSYLWILLLVLIAGGVVAALHDASTREHVPPPKRVWSEEHGHWHNERTQPTGPAPTGKVWSEEHGHWHDAASPPLNAEPGERNFSDPDTQQDSD